ncbi:MAG: HAMP domain-containing sensor histidine kinase [Ornithinimicrobium sp.]
MNLVEAAKHGVYQRLHGLSLTKRLVAVVVLMVLVAYVVTTSITIMLLRGELMERMDDELTQYVGPLGQAAYAQSVQGGSFVAPGVPNNYYVEITPRAAESTPFPFVTEATNPDHPDLPRIEFDDPSIGGGPFTVQSASGGTQWRATTEQLSNGVGTVTVALPTTPVEQTVRQLWVLTVLVGLATLLAVAAIGWWLVRRAFRPLTRIEDTASAIAAGDLTRRIPPPGAADEVASLSDSLNTMLADIEQAFVVRKASEQRMRQFVADASHELRTPLATVRGYAELYRFGAVREPEEVATAMRRIEDEATRMTRLVESLLMLTRWDSAGQMEREPVDLTVLTSDVVQDAKVRAPDRNVTLCRLGTGSAATVVVGDDGALRQVLTNLVANAIAHTPEGTDIEVALGVQAAQCVVEVRDHGEGIDAEAAERVFERFYRADAGRTRERGGTGLGLAIVATIVARHGGTVRHSSTPGGGATFRVELPLQPVNERPLDSEDDDAGATPAQPPSDVATVGFHPR